MKKSIILIIAIFINCIIWSCETPLVTRMSSFSTNSGLFKLTNAINIKTGKEYNLEQFAQYDTLKIGESKIENYDYVYFLSVVDKKNNSKKYQLKTNLELSEQKNNSSKVFYKLYDLDSKEEYFLRIKYLRKGIPKSNFTPTIHEASIIGKGIYQAKNDTINLIYESTVGMLQNN